jgi:hypothetical protein
MTTLHLYDAKDNWLRRAGYAAEYCEDYSTTAGKCLKGKSGNVHAGVSSIDEVKSYIDSIGKSVKTIDMIWFHTHGAPGYVHLPNGGIYETNVATLTPVCSMYLGMPAAIYFLGCNVGEGDTGRKFLKAAGKALLGHGGGRIVTSDSITMSVPGLGQRRPIWSSIVEATVMPGGSVTIVGG